MGMHVSFVAAIEELRAARQVAPGDESTAGREIREYGGSWHDPEVFARYLEVLRTRRQRNMPGVRAWSRRPPPCGG
jgi:hypothetical protein